MYVVSNGEKERAEKELSFSVGTFLVDLASKLGGKVEYVANPSNSLKRCVSYIIVVARVNIRDSCE